MSGKIVTLLLCLMLMLPGAALAAEEEHWVYPELKDYKQMIVNYKDGSSTEGPVTQEEWKSFHYNVLDPAKLDEPVQIYHWATMIKMGVELPKDRADELIDGYVYGLVQMYAEDINRETAIGGLMKLLSLSIVKATWDSTQADASKVFTDFKDVSDMQNGLIRIAYRDGLLDSGTKNTFRPKDKLTNAEAISIMYKVMKKYEQAGPQIVPPIGHWATAEIKTLLEKHRFTMDQKDQLNAGLAADDVIPVSLWHELLASRLGFPADKNSPEAMYTYGLAHGEFLSRDRAVAGLMKLWGPSRDATKAERQAASEAFSDYNEAFDTSKLAIAYGLGVIKGYGHDFGPERGLTYGEALVLLSRITAIGYIEKE